MYRRAGGLATLRHSSIEALAGDYRARPQRELAPGVHDFIRLGLSRSPMCALGQKRHFASFDQCPLYRRRRTLVERAGMSALCYKQTHAVQRKLIHAVSFVFVWQPHRLGHAGVISQKSAATSS